MRFRGIFALTVATALLVFSVVLACCPAPPRGVPVVNADQTVIIIWDEAAKTQHFIRQASFKSDAADFGFLVPSPTAPDLEESGNDAIPLLMKLTEPEIVKVPRPSNGFACGCGVPGAAPMAKMAPPVVVLQEKQVAGFHAVVLEAASADALTDWLKDNGYAFSPAIQAWAKPYIDQGWKITALKVAKGKDGQKEKEVAASSLRMSFKTDRPLFPYREPEPGPDAAALGASHRLLRIYFLADARFRGTLTAETPWSAKVAWAGPVAAADRTKLLESLRLPASTGPARWWLTEFEDEWAYRAAVADVTFSRDTDQATVKRPPMITYVRRTVPDDAMVYVLGLALFVPPVLRRVRRRKSRR
jgi:hypothetical protein